MPKDMVSRKVVNMQPSGIRAFFDLVLGMKDVISLGVGEPDFVTPWPICESGIYSLEQGFTSYTSNKGLAKLRLGVARYLKKRFGVEYSSDDEMLITVGVSEAMDLALRAIVNPGDEILIPSPGYVSYGPLTELAGGVPVYVDTGKNGFKLAPGLIEEHCGGRTKAIVLNYPANPTGVSYTRKELAAMQRVISRRGLLCISDEIYGDLTYDYEHVCYSSLPGARENTVLLNGFSKSYAMTGWRVGYACGPSEVIEAMTKIHQYTIMCVSITSQMAACEALATGKSSVEAMKREYNRRREFVVGELNRIGLACEKPQGAFYAFPSIKSTGMNSLDFARGLLEERKVAVIPGVAFGNAYDDRVRLSYASSFEKLREAMKRIEAYITGISGQRRPRSRRPR
jgi:aminotransferase